MSPFFFALIPAAGSGSRMSSLLPKQYLPIVGKPMIYHAIKTLYLNQEINFILVVLAPDDQKWSTYDWSEFSDKLIVLPCGGATRAESVLNGLKAAHTQHEINTDDWILVHDGARPCLTATQLNKMIQTLKHDEVGGLLAIPVADTLKRCHDQNKVVRTESREDLWQAQTPQMFRHNLLTKALNQADPTKITDDASAIEALGLQPKLITSDAYNFKVTYPQDLALAELILKQRNTQ